MDSDMKEFRIFMGVGIFCVFAWYYYWVVPHDEALYQIMDCMGVESSQEAYARCAKELK
jgi:hypothetical protein